MLILDEVVKYKDTYDLTFILLAVGVILIGTAISIIKIYNKKKNNANPMDIIKKNENVLDDPESLLIKKKGL